MIELIIAISLAAILFTGLAAVMGSALRTLAITRGRGQANEIATEGIEDLQRLDFSNLVLCNAPTVPPNGSVPSGFGALTIVLAASCSSAIIEQPCPLPSTTGLSAYPVPAANYTCSRFGNGYQVSRYIAWADSTQTVKRLAVVVDWTDSVGRHEVSQQSSVRAPDQAAVIGATPPTLTSATTYPSKVWVDSSGLLVTSTGAGQSINLTATASGLTSADEVNAYFITEDPLTLTQSTATIPLTSPDGATWLGSIPGAGTAGAPTFPTNGGTQYITFTAIRKSDGKANSILSSPAVTFCDNPDPGNSGGNCSINAQAPAVGNISLSPTSVAINPDGTLTSASSLTITVQTSNVYASTTTSDSVVAVLNTAAGATQVTMQPTCALNSSLSVCNTWAVTVDPSMSLRFAAGQQYVYVIADQTASSTGSTATGQSMQQVSFQ